MSRSVRNDDFRRDPRRLWKLARVLVMPFDAVDWFNAWEAVFWTGLGIAAGYQSLRSSPVHRRGLRHLAALLILFGISDIIEVQTGAWWQPWWLAALKITCAIGIIWQVISGILSGAIPTRHGKV